MLRSILVGLDGSEHSDSALELGIRWARVRRPAGRHGVVDPSVPGAGWGAGPRAITMAGVGDHRGTMSSTG